MSDKENYPAELLDHKRPEFELKIKRVAVESFGYQEGDSLLKLVTERNLRGTYMAEWVRGAWEGFKLAHTEAGHGLGKHTSIPTERGLYYYFENGTTEPRPVMIDPARWEKRFKSFNGAEQTWLREGEYLLGPQPVPAAQ